jgi:NADH dehydrogenase
MSATKIVMVGGGYTAVGLVGALRNAIQKGKVELTIVNRESYHVFHGFIPEMVTGRIGHAQVLSPVRRIFRPATVHVAEIEGVDFEQKVVHTNRHLDGRRYSIPYDHLVIGLGSSDNLAAYPGLAEHAFRLKTYDDCFRLRNHILAMLELAAIESDPAEQERLLTFFIAGGGYAGTEMAGELSEHIRTLIRRDYPQLQAAMWRVVLVTPGATILPELYGTKGTTGETRGFPKLVEFATKHLQKLGVEVLTNTKVAYATPNEVGLSDGKRVQTRTIISAVGTRPPALVETFDLPKQSNGKISTDEYLRVLNTPHVWAGGDCAAVPHPTGGFCPPIAIYALEHGKLIGQNILQARQGQPFKPFRFVNFGQGVNLGQRTAVAEVKGMEMKGTMAWVIGRLLLLNFVPSAERRLRTLLDWGLGTIFGRDMVEMSVADADDYEIEHHIFQAGETIVAKGYTGRYLYLITEGDAELMAEDGTITVLTIGGRCGRIHKQVGTIPEVRAKGMVRAVSVRYDQMQKLQDFLPMLKELPPSEV